MHWSGFGLGRSHDAGAEPFRDKHLGAQRLEDRAQALAAPARGRHARIYELAVELVRHSDGRFELDDIAAFLRSYQRVAPLTIGELWAWPSMLRLALVENLRRLADEGYHLVGPGRRRLEQATEARVPVRTRARRLLLDHPTWLYIGSVQSRPAVPGRRSRHARRRGRRPSSHSPDQRRPRTSRRRGHGHEGVA